MLVGGAKDGVSSARIEKKDHFALSFPSLSSLISSISIIALLFDKHCACTPVVTLKTTPTHNLKWQKAYQSITTVLILATRRGKQAGSGATRMNGSIKKLSVQLIQLWQLPHSITSVIIIIKSLTTHTNTHSLV